jgi:hypothetical protein
VDVAALEATFSASKHARTYAIPAWALDKHTERGKGTDTSARLAKAAELFRVDISGWSQEEQLKSHGPGVKPSGGKGKGSGSQVAAFFDVGAIVANKCLDDEYHDVCREHYLAEEKK